jgi:ATP-dependent DNA helicase RecG
MKISLQIPLSKVIKTTKPHLDRLSGLGIKTAQDLLLFFPRAYEDKSQYTQVSQIISEETNTLRGTLSRITHHRTKNGKTLSKALFSDETGSVEAVWFNQPYLKRVLQSGQDIILSGKAKVAFGKMTLQSPVFETPKEQDQQLHVGRIVPVYHQTEGITSKWIREKLKPIIDEWLIQLEEYMPADIVKEYGLADLKTAVKEVHFPSDDKKLEDAKKRLAFDELFLLQFKALQKKWRWQNITEHEKKSMPMHSEVPELIKSLPYTLTNAQKICLKEILDDMEKPFPMSRLLQGDVGSGKTVVAGASIFNAVKNGYQTAIMAPTEILARQHYGTLFKLLQPYGLNIQFISGSTPDGDKKQVLDGLKTGTVDLVIGTHSLIQEGVGFKNLGLAVIDEQHRFGVKQREVLKTGGSPHLLSLSATPIPRTLAMTIYGDQDLSVIDEMPAGRLPIITRIVPEKKRRDAYRWIEEQIKTGRQAFVICPLIDESDVLEVKSVMQEYEQLREHVFPNLKVGLIHGKMKSSEKDEIMDAFSKNKIQILVSTSVIEVGIDVPNASIMIIEGSDRFGLSQLHQFRGRVGRGEHQSYCFLFTQSRSDDAKSRLNAMVLHTSGFRLSEIDLNLRGPGEIYGVRQSGIPDLKMASLTDSITIKLARDAAQKLLTEDPELDKHPLLKKKLEKLDDVYVTD